MMILAMLFFLRERRKNQTLILKDQLANYRKTVLCNLARFCFLSLFKGLTVNILGFVSHKGPITTTVITV